MQPQPDADIMAAPLGWVAPAQPANGRCLCGAAIEAVYRDPVWVLHKLVVGSGCWSISPLCGACHVRRDSEQAADRIASCGLSRVHQPMELENWTGAGDSARECVKGFVEDKNGLYIFGPPGTGKSHAAAGALKARIRRTGQGGMFLIVPEFAIELRQLASVNRVGEMLAKISWLDAIVLDGLGVERPTELVAEALYVLIDRMWRDRRTGLIITSTFDLVEMSHRYGGSLASRIVDLCLLLKFDGPDNRLK